MDRAALLKHYEEIISQQEDDIATFLTGNMRMFNLRDGQRIDITDEWVAELRQRNANLQAIIDIDKAKQSQA